MATLKSIVKAKKNIKVLIKRHPRFYNFNEENVILNKIIKKFKKKLNIKLSNTNTIILSYFSKINICLFSNSIFACRVLTSPGDRSAETSAPEPSPVTVKFAYV